jgi:hypothetical protein
MDDFTSFLWMLLAFVAFGCAAALVVSLTGCSLEQAREKYRTEISADCCKPGDAGDSGDASCEWQPITYFFTKHLERFASDARACRDVGLEPYR